MFGDPYAFHPNHLIGPPPQDMNYGSAPYHSWSPATKCNVAANSSEFVIVRKALFLTKTGFKIVLISPDFSKLVQLNYNTSVFVTSVEVYENYNPGAVDKIYVWDPSSESWVLLVQADPVDISNPILAPPVYSVFIPEVCQSTW